MLIYVFILKLHSQSQSGNLIKSNCNIETHSHITFEKGKKNLCLIVLIRMNLWSIFQMQFNYDLLTENRGDL